MDILRILSRFQIRRADSAAVSRRQQPALRDIRIFGPPDVTRQWGEWRTLQAGLQGALSVRFRSVRNDLMTSRHISTVQLRNNTGSEVCFGLELNGDRGERLLRTHVWISPQEVSEWSIDARGIASLRIGAFKVLDPAAVREGA